MEDELDKMNIITHKSIQKILMKQIKITDLVYVYNSMSVGWSVCQPASQDFSYGSKPEVTELPHRGGIYKLSYCWGEEDILVPFQGHF